MWNYTKNFSNEDLNMKNKNLSFPFALPDPRTLQKQVEQMNNRL